MIKYKNYERKYIEQIIIDTIMEYFGPEGYISFDAIVKSVMRSGLRNIREKKYSPEEISIIVRDIAQNSKKIILDGDKCILSDTYKKRIELKNNVVINFILNSKPKIPSPIVASAILLSAPFVVGAIINQSTSNIEEYKQSVIVYNDKEYTVNDLYAVYTPDNVYFCNRKLNQNNDSDNNEVYDYYDIKTGNKICSDNEDGFMIEKFTDLPFREEFSQFNNKMTLDEIENRMLRDYMVYGEERNRRI